MTTQPHDPTDPDTYYDPATRHYDVTAYLADNHADLCDLYGPGDKDDAGHIAALMVLRNIDLAREIQDVAAHARPVRGDWWWALAVLVVALAMVVMSAPVWAL